MSRTQTAASAGGLEIRTPRYLRGLAEREHKFLETTYQRGEEFDKERLQRVFDYFLAQGHDQGGLIGNPEFQGVYGTTNGRVQRP